MVEVVVSKHQQDLPREPDVPVKRRRYSLPLGVAVAGVGTIAAILLRGCWHRHLGWPMRYDERYSYQVCTDCGMKRLYDAVAFRPYGPYGHDLEELIARDHARRVPQQKRSA